jgi:hypothetical protein
MVPDRSQAPRLPTRRAGGSGWSFELTPDGPDGTVVTEIFDCSQVPEDQRVDIDNGSIWVEGIRQTLERLDALCARQAAPGQHVWTRAGAQSRETE